MKAASRREINLKLPDPRSVRSPTGVASQAYEDDESEFITAVARFRQVNKISFPTLTQLLWVLKKLGWQRIDPK